MERIPILHAFVAGVRRHLLAAGFRGSSHYWEKRYATGGDSGDGSYGRLAEFKARTLNAFVDEKGVRSVIEYGCGDGNQLKLASYPRYVGVDVSATAVSRCRRLFASDPTKSFKLLGDVDGDRADLALSLDVVFHLVEDEVFESHMRSLFSSATRYVVIYSSNSEEPERETDPHVRNRRFTRWIERNVRGWRLARVIPNAYPPRVGNGSLSNFYVFEKTG